MSHVSSKSDPDVGAESDLLSELKKSTDWWLWAQMITLKKDIRGEKL